ncbi:unnamed protein product [Amoebophrya sp. A25]|nr:unnamed protein product [Amoebophrya sp. A25]|eukprot:GSA25T00021945001.1
MADPSDAAGGSSWFPFLFSRTQEGNRASGRGSERSQLNAVSYFARGGPGAAPLINEDSPTRGLVVRPGSTTTVPSPAAGGNTTVAAAGPAGHVDSTARGPPPGATPLLSPSNPNSVGHGEVLQQPEAARPPTSPDGARSSTTPQWRELTRLNGMRPSGPEGLLVADMSSPYYVPANPVVLPTSAPGAGMGNNVNVAQPVGYVLTRPQVRAPYGGPTLLYNYDSGSLIPHQSPSWQVHGLTVWCRMQQLPVTVWVLADTSTSLPGERGWPVTQEMRTLGEGRHVRVETGHLPPPNTFFHRLRIPQSIKRSAIAKSGYIEVCTFLDYFSIVLHRWTTRCKQRRFPPRLSLICHVFRVFLVLLDWLTGGGVFGGGKSSILPTGNVESSGSTTGGSSSPRTRNNYNENKISTSSSSSCSSSRSCGLSFEEAERELPQVNYREVPLLPTTRSFEHFDVYPGHDQVFSRSPLNCRFLAEKRLASTSGGGRGGHTSRINKMTQATAARLVQGSGLINQDDASHKLVNQMHGGGQGVSSPSQKSRTRTRRSMNSPPRNYAYYDYANARTGTTGGSSSSSAIGPSGSGPSNHGGAPEALLTTDVLGTIHENAAFVPEDLQWRRHDVQLRQHFNELHLCLPQSDLARIDGRFAANEPTIPHQRRPLPTAAATAEAEGRSPELEDDYDVFLHDAVHARDITGRTGYDLSDTFVRELISTFFRNQMLRLNSGLSHLGNNAAGIAMRARALERMEQATDVLYGPVAQQEGSVQDEPSSSSNLVGGGGSSSFQEVDPQVSAGLGVVSPGLRSPSPRRGGMRGSSNRGAASANHYVATGGRPPPPTRTNAVNLPTSINATTNSTGPSSSRTAVPSRSRSRLDIIAEERGFDDSTSRTSTYTAKAKHKQGARGGAGRVPLRIHHPEADVYSFRLDQTPHFVLGAHPPRYARIDYLVRNAGPDPGAPSRVIVNTGRSIPRPGGTMASTSSSISSTTEAQGQGGSGESIDPAPNVAASTTPTNYTGTAGHNYDEQTGTPDRTGDDAAGAGVRDSSMTVGEMAAAVAQELELDPVVVDLGPAANEDELTPEDEGGIPFSSNGGGSGHAQQRRRARATMLTRPEAGRRSTIIEGRDSLFHFRGLEGSSSPGALPTGAGPPPSASSSKQVKIPTAPAETTTSPTRRPPRRRPFRRRLNSDPIPAVPTFMNFVDAVWTARPQALNWSDVIGIWNRRQQRLREVRYRREADRFVQSDKNNRSSTGAGYINDSQSTSQHQNLFPRTQYGGSSSSSCGALFSHEFDRPNAEQMRATSWRRQAYYGEGEEVNPRGVFYNPVADPRHPVLSSSMNVAGTAETHGAGAGVPSLGASPQQAQTSQTGHSGGGSSFPEQKDAASDATRSRGLLVSQGGSSADQEEGSNMEMLEGAMTTATPAAFSSIAEADARSAPSRRHLTPSESAAIHPSPAPGGGGGNINRGASSSSRGGQVTFVEGNEIQVRDGTNLAQNGDDGNLVPPDEADESEDAREVGDDDEIAVEVQGSGQDGGGGFADDHTLSLHAETIEALVRKISDERRAPFISPRCDPSSQLTFFLVFLLCFAFSAAGPFVGLLSFLFWHVEATMDPVADREGIAESYFLLNFLVLFFGRTLASWVCFYEMSRIVLQRGWEYKTALLDPEQQEKRKLFAGAGAAGKTFPEAGIQMGDKITGSGEANDTGSSSHSLGGCGRGAVMGTLGGLGSGFTYIPLLEQSQQGQELASPTSRSTSSSSILLRPEPPNPLDLVDGTIVPGEVTSLYFKLLCYVRIICSAEGVGQLIATYYLSFVLFSFSQCDSVVYWTCLPLLIYYGAQPYVMLFLFLWLFLTFWFAYVWIVLLDFSGGPFLQGLLSLFVVTETPNTSSIEKDVLKKIPVRLYSDVVRDFPRDMQEEVARVRRQRSSSGAGSKRPSKESTIICPPVGTSSSNVVVPDLQRQVSGGLSNAALPPGENLEPGPATQCSICFTEFEENDYVIQSPCFAYHVFHPECITDWWRQSRLCPLCRTDIPEKVTGHKFRRGYRWRFAAAGNAGGEQQGGGEGPQTGAGVDTGVEGGRDAGLVHDNRDGDAPAFANVTTNFNVASGGANDGAIADTPGDYDEDPYQPGPVEVVLNMPINEAVMEG